MNRLIPIALGQMIFLVFGLVSAKVITHLVSEEVYGQYQLFLTLVQIGTLLTHAGLYNYTTRCWHREHAQPGPYARFLWGMNLRRARMTAGLLLGALIILTVMKGELLWLLMFPLLLAINLALTTNAVAAGMLTVDDRQWSVCGMSLVSNVTRTFLPALGVMAGGASLVALSVGYTVYAVVLFVVTLFFFRPMWRTPTAPAEKARQWMNELAGYGRPWLLMGLGSWLLMNADRWVVAHFFDEKRVGVFSLAATLGATVPGVMVAAMMQLVLPRVFRAADEARDHHDWRRMAQVCDRLTLGYLLACVGGIVGLWLVGPHLVGVLIDRKYEAAMPLLLPVGMSAISIFANQFYQLVLQGQQNVKDLVKVGLVVAGMKTLGSIVAAAISWECFLAWLTVSMLFTSLVGRALIRAAVFRREGGGDSDQPGK